MATAIAEAPAPIITRREFLYYIWGASIALFTAELTGLIIWFAIPRFREGEFGGNIPVSTDDVPPINAKPVDKADGRFWLVNLDTRDPNNLMYSAEGDPGEIIGVAAIYKVCTHLGCIYAWNDANERFECPCHGSKYRLDGRRIESPAPRSLDRFQIVAVDSSDAVLAQSEIDSATGMYKPLIIPDGTTRLLVDTGALTPGPSQTLICEIRGNCP